jgi:enediyne biosynthesis protein E5
MVYLHTGRSYHCVISYKGKHIFNPSAFGIVATVLLTKEAWLSPAQWGSSAVLFFGVCCLGLIVVTKVQKLDITLAFLLTFAGLLFIRQIIYLNWSFDVFLQSVSTGSLLLFSFFMTSDPKTAPNHPAARIIWAVLIATVAFYLSAFKWMNNTPIYVLVFAAPLVPVFNWLLKAKHFEWSIAKSLPNKNQTITQHF